MGFCALVMFKTEANTPATATGKRHLKHYFNLHWKGQARPVGLCCSLAQSEGETVPLTPGNTAVTPIGLLRSMPSQRVLQISTAQRHPGLSRMGLGSSISVGSWPHLLLPTCPQDHPLPSFPMFPRHLCQMVHVHTLAFQV